MSKPKPGELTKLVWGTRKKIRLPDGGPTPEQQRDIAALRAGEDPEQASAEAADLAAPAQAVAGAAGKRASASGAKRKR